ncbi:MAG: N-acetylmuramoyl-L-alanine amidase [Clostridia bacterium]|nr:N-acetylmuramoyl-L-alanine amidase [Clostridia bacterium]
MTEPFKLILVVLFVLFITLIFFSSSVSATTTIVLDPGHGGKDSGAVNGETHESDVALKIAKYLKEYLNKYQNVKVILTHEELESNKELSVFERAIIARENKADILISLHINSSLGTAEGAEIYVTANESLDKYNKNTTLLANKILTNLGKLGIKNRGVITKLIPKDTTDVYSDGTRADYMGIIRYSMRGTMIDSGKVTILKDGKKVEVPPETSANVEKRRRNTCNIN